MGVDKDLNIWIMPDLVWGRFATDYVVEKMIDLIAKFKPLYWWAERGHISKSIGPFLRKRMLERSIFGAIVEVTPTHDKKTRAQAINARIAMRMVYFPSFAPWWSAAGATRSRRSALTKGRRGARSRPDDLPRPE